MRIIYWRTITWIVLLALAVMLSLLFHKYNHRSDYVCARGWGKCYIDVPVRPEETGFMLDPKNNPQLAAVINEVNEKVITTRKEIRE